MVRAGCLVMGGSSRRWAAGSLILMDDRGDAAVVWTGRSDHRRRPSHVGPPAAHTPRHPAAAVAAAAASQRLRRHLTHRRTRWLRRHLCSSWWPLCGGGAAESRQGAADRRVAP